MKKLVPLILILWSFLGALSCHAGFSAMYVFGDGICTTNSALLSGTESSLYYGKRCCNGRLWVEVLAQWQGLPLADTNNFSYYAQESGDLVTSLPTRTWLANTTNALVLVWAADADYVDFLTGVYKNGDISTNAATWNAAEALYLTNHYKVLTNLCGYGIRTIVMPGAVDLCKIPYYSGTPVRTKAFVRAQILDFNQKLTNVMQIVRGRYPAANIYYPDLCNMFDRILANPTAYGFNADTNGAIFELSNTALNGPGTNFVFWDDENPSARSHMVIAELVQKLISPPKLASVTWSNKTSRIVISNTPVGRNGNIEVSTNLTYWSNLLTSFSSTNLTQTVSVPATNSMQFYRVCFPFVWTWP